MAPVTPPSRKPSVGNIEVPVPPPEEQAVIVRYLDESPDELINRYISAKERLIALLEEQRQAVIHQAITRGLDTGVNLMYLPRYPGSAKSPSNWEMKRLAELNADVTSEHHGAQSQLALETFPAVRVADFNPPTG